MTVIECKGLTKSYRNKSAIKNISFSIEENKIVGLIGRNGAGKTTLLKLIAGYHRKSSGELSVFSEDPVNNIKVATNMIFVDDQMELPGALTLADILQTAGLFYPNWDMQLASRLADYFSLAGDRYHNELSKGMKSTFNMILGIASRCPLTIFDEPTTGMDAGVRKDFYRALLKDYIAFPRTIILSSHLLNEIEDILEDILLLKQGEICLHLSVEELKQYAIGLIGNRQMIEPWIKDQTVYYQTAYGQNVSLVVLRNTFTDQQLQTMKESGIETTSVSANDICMYLTSSNKGGIDDVFDRQ